MKESKGKERKAAPNEQKAGKGREGRKEGGRIERRKRERAGIEEKKGASKVCGRHIYIYDGTGTTAYSLSLSLFVRLL